MTDYEKCKQDLDRWDFYYLEGNFYNDHGEAVSMWIAPGGMEDKSILFDMDGNYIGWC